ncbi:conserved membrane hypothetical protein [Vibrio nigripulchritudo SOn1]|uniref:Uncharacterized protein n=1 Tax=Vibrio nigripulchritudo SOn1 TaxID=1238450 RepID=A0AAV2VX09_9VIBR|nr:DUF5455 family protein [Vibrio nigripulchritudo]CCO48890.1 conserved membrane hypothetical protein [Vibrio nigripulchritudo SOn1]
MIALLPILTTVGNFARLPALAAFLGGIASQLLTFFATRFTRTVAINLTIVTMIIGLAYVTSMGIYTALTGLSFIVPDWIDTAFGFFVPNNAVPCASVVLSARLMRWVWEWQAWVILRMAA